MAFWSSRSNKRVTNNKNRSASKPKAGVNPYHSVAVKIPYDACEAVMQLHGKRFLSAEAPQLPLAACDQHCECTFKHYNDRRQEERRDAFNSSGIHYSGEKNRRIGSDRRHKKINSLYLG